MAKIIFNDTIPVKGYKAMALWPWVFVRNECKERFTAIDSNHETIHLRQQVEMLIVGVILTLILFICGLGLWSLFALPIFFIWYGLEWFLRWCAYGFDQNEAYHNISFEQEAYGNESNLDYLRTRKRFSWFYYLLKKTYNRR